MNNKLYVRERNTNSGKRTKHREVSVMSNKGGQGKVALDQ